jgi:hydroxymethylpyrimidine pyrophosphatase-like HAD family hydrolase
MGMVDDVLTAKAKERCWIYCDIDGTLTEDGHAPWGKPRIDVIWKLKDAIAAGYTVVLWSACGKKYCEDFAKAYHIFGLHGCLSKPSLIVDDNKQIRDETHCKRLFPFEFLAESLEVVG